MKCPECGYEKVLKGRQVVNIPLSDGTSELSVLVCIVYCDNCHEFCEIETELV